MPMPEGETRREPAEVAHSGPRRIELLVAHAGVTTLDLASWAYNSPSAKGKARRALNKRAIDAVCQGKGDIAWANLVTACISNVYDQGLSTEENTGLITCGNATSYTEAMSSPDAERWKLAMKEQ